MPLYTYYCGRCGVEHELVVAFAERDGQPCRQCNGKLERRGVERFAVGKPRYQMQAVLRDGAHIKGHFGKAARFDRTKRAKQA